MSDLVQLTMNGAIGQLTLHRPDAFNAFGIDMADELCRQLSSLGNDEKVTAVVITGSGKAFCAGGDLKWILQGRRGPASAFRELAARFHQAIIEIRRMRKPAIAAINGVAAGGGFSLALACDLRVMARDAVLRQAYTSSGLSVDGGGTFTLPRLVGHARAMEILAFDKPIPAEQALQWGLANEVVERDAVLPRALELARELGRRSLSSFAWSKQLLNASFHTSLETQLEQEREALAACASHADGVEGLQAFLEKRQPLFGRGEIPPNA